jgi:hypothetical protein
MKKFGGRKWSAEQIQKREVRKAQFRALWKQVADMPELQRIQLANKVGIVTCEGHELSLANQCLLALQCPNVSVVGGFRQWIKQGRAVVKGQHGHMIWVPIGKGQQTNGAGQKLLTNGQQTGEQTGSDGDKPGFTIGTVFDISQTQEIETAEKQVREVVAELEVV